MRAKSTPKISVIVPVYNTEKYLAESLDSVIRQTFKDIEIICVDDGSTDNSSNILSKYAKKDSRIKVISQKNQGVITARNNAIKQAEGDYIYTLDSDDVIDETTLEKSYKAIIAGKGDIITCRIMCFGEQNEEMRLPKPNKINMAGGNCLVNAALFKKSLFDKSGGFDHAFDKELEDYDFWLNMVYRQNATFYRIPEILFFYRIKPAQESRNKQQSQSCNDELMDKLRTKYPEMKRYKRLGKIISNFFQIRVKQTKTIIRILKLPVFTIKIKPNKRAFYILGFIPCGIKMEK